MQSKHFPEAWQIPLETSCVVIKKFETRLNFLRSEIKTSQMKRDTGQASLVVFVSWVSSYILKISIAFFFSAEKYYLERLYLHLWFNDMKMQKSFDLKITLKYSKNASKVP